VLLTLAIALALGFGLDGRSSEARKIKPRTPASQPAPLTPTPSPPTITSPPVHAGPPGLPRAAANAVQELTDSGDGSNVRWFEDTGLWGKHDAPPGDASWPTPSEPGIHIGWFSPYWWQSALDLRALVRYLEQTHNTSPVYQQIIDRTFQLNVRRPHSNMPVNFGNQFMDDTIWWGQAWLEAARYELNIRHDVADAKRFMNVAIWDANDAWRSPRTCHTQGIAWEIGFPPDTVTNAEFIALAGELAQVQEQPGPWLDRAAASKWITEGWRMLWWLRHVRLINLRTGHVYDQYDARCRPAGGSLTYTEGETADALVQMGLATGQRKYLADAHHFIHYALSPVTHMVYNGVLQEPCEAEAQICQDGRHILDASVWKGVVVDAVADWQAATGSRAYDAFLIRQARAVIDHSASNGSRLTKCETPHDCQLGFYWARSIPPDPQHFPVGPGSQESGLSALTDALSTSSGYTG
jgi:hypothetical protein